MGDTRSLKEVFEQIKSRERRSLRNFNEGSRGAKCAYSAESECDLVIDDDCEDTITLKKRQRGVRLAVEPTCLVCNWNECFERFNNYPTFIEHTQEHALAVEEDENGNYSCRFTECKHKAKAPMYLVKHVAFHSFHERLKNVGENVAERSKLPKCSQSLCYEVPAIECDYGCEWKDCDSLFGTIHEYLAHIKVHIHKCPKYCKKNEVIKCEWKACRSKFTSQYKLGDHVRSHTKEKTIACPTCGTMFASKTKFTDHRKRQIPTELHSFQCSECSKLFPTERLLRDHIRSHINHYKCNMCDMTAQKPSMVAKHIRLRHLNERPFKCTLCEQCCTTKYNLETHLATHCAEKLMECDECDYKCRSAHALERHYQVVHGQGIVQIYECHCCSEQFQRGGNLTKHLMKNHDFNWPSGHSRFRYKQDSDGMYRLQTVRYESLEVTQEMMAFQPPIKKNIKYIIKREPDREDGVPSFVLKVASTSDEKTVIQPTNNEIIITIDDVDEKGNIIRTEVVKSNEIISTNGVNSLGSIVEECYS